MDEKIFDLMEKMYTEFSKRFDNMENDIKGLKTDVVKINSKIEHDLMPKITVLFDGYKQNSEKLDRIEKEVSKHDEIILRRVK